MNDEIEYYYSQAQEQNRLLGDEGELERLRTEAILKHYLPSPPAVIYDVGGGAGIYAFALGQK